MEDQRVNDIVLVAIEQNWDAILAHKEVIRRVAEMIVRQGMQTGEFEPGEPGETAALLLRSMVHYCHPILLAQCLRDGEDVEAGVAAQIRFLLRAITPRS